MGWPRTVLTAAPTAVANGYVTSTAMINGDYTLAANVPAYGARHVTLVRTVVGGADTVGTVTFTGTDPAGQTITEVLTPGANGVTITGTKFFKSVSKITGADWATNTGDDTIVCGWDNQNAVAVGQGVLHGIFVSTSAAGTITLTDATGTIAVFASNTAVGFYGPIDVNFTGFLRAEISAAYTVAILHSGSQPAY